MIEASAAEVSVLESIKACEEIMPGVSSMLEISALEVSKASVEADVLIKTPDGNSYVLHVPQNKKEHDVSPQKVDWGVSHRKAHLAIVDDPRNSMIKVKHAKALGAVIALCVMEDRAKIDRQTGFLLKLKSRIIMLRRGARHSHQDQDR